MFLIMTGMVRWPFLERKSPSSCIAANLAKSSLHLMVKTVFLLCKIKGSDALCAVFLDVPLTLFKVSVSTSDASKAKYSMGRSEKKDPP